MRKALYELLAVCLVLLVLATVWRYHADHAIRSLPARELSIDGNDLRIVLRDIAEETRYEVYGDCAPLTLASIERLHAEGYAARLVVLLTTDEWNGYNDGHTVTEVFDPSLAQWIIFDASTDRIYEQSAVAFVRQRADYEQLGTDHVIAPGFDDFYGIFSDLEAFYDRVGQVALIQAPNGSLASGDREYKAVLESYGADYKYDSNFMTNYYLRVR